nr:transposase [Lactobacillus johnsonii]
MGMRLKSTKSKYSESFSIIDDYTHPETNKRSTFVVEALGSLNSLMEKYQTTDREVVVNHLKDYIEKRKQQLKAENGKVLIEVAQKDLIEKDETRIYNVGYLYIKDILCSLGLKCICQEIQTRYKIQFNLFDILCDLVCTRIIEPCSKRATFEYKKRFLHQSTYQLEDVYRALHILYQERYTIENALYQGSTKLYPRNTNVLYYDCTNFYFETEEPDEFRLYGFSKEHRPNPIVQYGLFMDGNGIPLADYAFAGNMNEQPTLRKLEQKIEEDFQLKKFIVVADAGLNGWENKVYNNMKNNHAYIVTQPIKKLKKSLQEWAIDPSGWRISGSREKFNLQDIMNAAENAETDLKHYKINIDGTERNVYDLIFTKKDGKRQQKNLT